MTEHWLPIVGFEGLYEVSDQGRIRNSRTALVLRPSAHHRDKHLNIRLCANGKSHNRLVHRLVLEAFVGPCPPGMEACHFPDRDPSNNRLTNLRWDTCSANRIDAVKHGTLHGLERTYDYSALRQMRADGLTPKEIRERTGISKGHLWKVLARWNWRTSGVPLT